MSADLNVVTLTGRLTKDAETRMAGGTPVAVCRFASTARRKNGDQWEDVPNYFDVIVWGREGLHQYLVRGKQLAISGELRWREWEKDGTKHQRVEINVNQGGHIGLLGGGDDKPAQRNTADDFDL